MKQSARKNKIEWVRKKVGISVIRIPQVKVNISEIYQKNIDTCKDRTSWERLYQKEEALLLRKKICKLLRCKPGEIQDFCIVKRSIDARKKKEIFYTYSVDVALGTEKEKRICSKIKNNVCQIKKKLVYQVPMQGQALLSNPPVIVGFGPAGMFCALMLAKAGYCPLVLEQGKKVEDRVKDVENFWKTGKLEPWSNVQFGEGGAGTFSDGKLNCSVKDTTGRIRKVLELFVEHGAPAEILYQQKPHIGTDALCKIVKNIRTHIEELGGIVTFESKVTDLKYNAAGALQAVQVNGQDWISTQVAVFAIGHSARDTFACMQAHGLQMEQKPFAVGVRVEHPQKKINQHQYGDMAKVLPPADYKVTYHTQKDRSVFSFCMCPGGFVVNASSEAGGMVVNGMSDHDRGEENANSAIVVNVLPEDFDSEDVLAGVAFQRKWEALAYQEGKGKIPVQLWKDFKEKKQSTRYGDLQPVHRGENEFGNLWNCLPTFVSEALLEGIAALDGKIPGFADPDVILSGVETRTSSPVRILRDETLQSNKAGIYPCGEGAGYAGGITSAAVDGIKIFEAIYSKYQSKKEKVEYE